MSNIKIEIDLDDYIAMLERRKRKVADDFGWTIPDGVWNFFLETLEDCGSVGENSSPSYVVDNIAVNGDYGPVENYGVFDDMLREYKDVYIDDNGNEKELSDDEARELMQDLEYSHMMELFESVGGDRDSFFTYEEPDSDYGFGVCYSL